MGRKLVIPAILIGVFIMLLLLQFVLYPLFRNFALSRGTVTSEVVYEIDGNKYLRSLAQNRDELLDDILASADREAAVSDSDYYEVLLAKFNAIDQPLAKYFNKYGQSDSEIISALKIKTMEDIEEDQNILKNRIRNFGLIASFEKQENACRIAIELKHKPEAAIERILGETALLELKLVRDPEFTMSVLTEIDSTLKLLREGDRPIEELELNAAVAVEEILLEQEQAEDEEVDLSELFGQDRPEVTGEVASSQDSAILVDQPTFKEHPFFSLLREQPGVPGVVMVPQQNVITVKRLLQMPEIKRVIPSDSEFLWSARGTVVGGQEYSQLYLLKIEPEIIGNHVKDAKTSISGGESQARSGQAAVNFELNAEGTEIFSRVTSANAGKYLAIVLDGKVTSNPPRIKERIPNGRCQIDGIATIEEARNIAIVMRTGALPAPLSVISVVMKGKKNN